MRFIYLHHVLDEWFETVAQPRLKGRCQLVRYADDAVMAFGDHLSGKRMLAVLGSLKITELVLILTAGRPAGTTEVMMTYVYKKFFGYLAEGASNYGYASSLAVVSAVILGIITFTYLKYTNKRANIY